MHKIEIVKFNGRVVAAFYSVSEGKALHYALRYQFLRDLNGPAYQIRGMS